MQTGLGFDQLGCHSHRIVDVISADAAFEDKSDTQLTSDFSHIPINALVSERGSPRGNAQ